MAEEVSDERNTRYFQVHRTQPFLITFVQALMAFKRVAKVMKIVFARRAMKKEKTLSNSMKQIIRRSTQDVISASHGAPVITMSAEEMKHHRYLVKLRKKVSASEAAPNSVPKVSSPITKSKVHLPMHMGDKLKKILVVTAEPSFKETADTGAGVGTGLHNLMQKNAAIQDAENKYVREYVPGTVIYYGSTIAIQARHGGYLSFNDPKNIKASAHKVMPHSRYIVSNANDATYTGAIKYGDAVMLQAGQHEVLGAQFTGTPQQGETSRKIKPALINFRKENSQRAQSYGRWIVVNKHDPQKKMGHPVTHFDKILLEQEWYFLGSCAPYESSMYKHSNFEIALDRKNVSSGSKLFNPREDCTWKFVLVSLPTDKNEEERIREYMMQDAAVQIVQSGEGRWKTRERLNVNIVNSLPEHLKVKHVAETELAHKQTPEDAQQAMVNKYDQIAMSNFGSDAHNLKLLEALYGAESVVFQNALRACQIRKEQLEAIGGTVKKELKKQYKKERSDLEKSRIEFWDNCNKLLVSSEAYANMPSFMEKYYNSDHIKKFKAGMLILKFINKRRNRLKTKFSYAVEMRNVDKIAKQKIIEQEKHDRLFQIEQERILELAANKAVRLAEAAAANTTASSAVSTSRVTRNRGAKINIGKGRNTSIVTQIPQRLNSLRKSSSSFIKIKGLPDSNKNEHIRRHLSTDPPNSTNLGTFVTKVKPAMGGENAIEAVGKEDFDSRPCSPHEANVLRAQMEVMAKFNYVDQIQMDDDNNAGSPYHSRGNSPSNSSIRPSYSTNSLVVDTQGNSLNQRMPPRPSTASVIDKGRIGASMPAIREDATSVSRPNSPHPQSPHSAPHIVLGHNRLLNSPNIKHARKYVLSQDGHEGHEEVMYKSSSPVPASPARNPFTPKYAETSPIRKVESNSNSKPYHEVSNSTPARPHTAGGATKARPHSKSRPGSANKAVSSGTSSCGHWSRRPCSANIYAPPPSYEKDTPCEANDARAHLRRSVEHANEHKFNAAMNTRNLAQTPSRTYGLPRDVMRHQQKNSVSLDTSIKFLQAASKNPNLFEDVSAKQKRFQ